MGINLDKRGNEEETQEENNRKVSLIRCQVSYVFIWLDPVEGEIISTNSYLHKNAESPKILVSEAYAVRL